jgi:hypothetical protein
MLLNVQSKKLAEIVHPKTMKVLPEDGFYDLHGNICSGLMKVDYIYNKESMKVRGTQELLDIAFESLPLDVVGFDRSNDSVQMIIGSEFIGGMNGIMQRSIVRDLSEEVELIKSNSLDRNFLKDKLRRKHNLRFWQPQYFFKDTYPNWLEKGEIRENK